MDIVKERFKPENVILVNSILSLMDLLMLLGVMDKNTTIYTKDLIDFISRVRKRSDV